MARSGRTINVNDVIDSRPLSRFQIATFALCVLTGAIDGFDSQSIAFVAPSMAGDLGIDIRSFGPIFAAGNVGGMIGALTLPVIADRVGRRGIIIVSVVMFALFTFANAFARTYDGLILVRFLCGLGIGSALPSVIALSTEYAPRARRALLVTIVTSGFPAGAMIAGALTSAAAPRLGWQSVFYFGAAAPLVLAAFLAVYLPGSIRFLVGRDAAPARVAAQLRRIARDLAVTERDTFFLPEAKFKGLPVKHLFTEGRAGMTLLIWFVYFMNLFLLFFLYNWMPPVLQQAGLPLTQALISTVLFNLGGVVGGIALGQLADKIGTYRVLIGAYAAGAVFLGAVGFLGGSTPLIMGALLLAGFSCIGAQTTANPMTASLYPTLMRSTGLGWAFGVARFGTIFGPIVGGIFMARGWDLRAVFLAAVVPPLCAGTAILVLRRVVDVPGEIVSGSVRVEPAPAAPPPASSSPRPRGAIVGLEAVLFGVDDVATCATFFADVGLERREGGRTGARFAIAGEDTIIDLRERRDPGLPPPVAPGESLREIVWGVSDRDALGLIAGELARDRDVREDADGRICVIGPDNFPLAFQVTRARHVAAPPVTPAVSRVNGRIRGYERPTPSHLGHVGLFSSDIEATARFYERLGFRLSDRITEFGLFLRGTGSIDHHNLFAIKRDKPGLNHLNLRLADVDELGTGMSFLERRGWRPVWGMGRHFFGSHMFGFFDNPAGSYLEFTCDEDFILDDNQWQPMELDARTTPITMWGPMLPDEVFKGEKPRL
ncbi:MAG TPA: MFS transporter [Stellaceae bacterium]|nr:MFS transporter [Stellaceae bacterium]